ncbi:MAG: FHA domain-containing protein, partial [Blastocatellia bacterium]
MRRILERLGEAVDKKIGGPPESSEKRGLSVTEIAKLETALERAIDEGVVRDSVRGGNIAPNRLQVLLTHESAGGLGKTYLTSLEEALRASAFEFINNRRYSVADDIRVEVATDVLAKANSVKASVSQARGEAGKKRAPGSTDSRRCLVEFKSEMAGCKVDLLSSAAPANIGRLASCAVFVDDPSISRLHAAIALSPAGDLVISDLGSANGTSVNGEIVNTGEARKLAAGDMITVGDVELTVVK